MFLDLNYLHFLPSTTGFAAFLGVESGLWSVEGGNKLVCVGLLSASKARLMSGAVLSVEEKTQQKGRSGTVSLKVSLLRRS